MGIFKRVKTIALADMNDVLDKREDPIKMVKQYSRDLEVELEKAQAALANQLYLEQKLEAQIKQVKQTIEDRKRQEQLALEKNNDNMAKLAIQDRLDSEKQLALLEDQFLFIQNQTNQIKAQVITLKETYADLKNRQSLLISRANVASTTNTINSKVYSFQSKNIANEFARMEDKVLHLEAVAATHDYLSEKTALYEKSSSIEVEEEFLKAKEALNKKSE
ncbi:PspA/IM30 family protein [Metabacillus litoralis]|uniref:PspA/IM30 family protein n=1 Tax=Metabacillus litoralis TaxID=152268 RepID=UPI000EF562BB|nr:PspA/IM30 family protein [Metabacillus litoralis]